MCSCLENPRDGGAWWAAVYGVAQSRIGLKRLSSRSSSAYIICKYHSILYRDLNICQFWYPQGILEPILTRTPRDDCTC